MASNGFISLVNEPTRISNDSATCIDHLFVKLDSRIPVKASNLNLNLTDHNLIQCNFDLNLSLSDSVSNNLNYSRIDYNLLIELLTHESWSGVYTCTNSSLAFSNFINILSAHISSAEYIVSPKKSTKLKPWMTSNLLSLIKQLKKFSLKLSKYPNNIRLARYVKRLRLRTKKEIESAKNDYFRDRFRLTQNQPKLIWKTVDEFLGRKSSPIPINSILSIADGQVLNEPDLIADEFNNFFRNIPYELLSEHNPMGFSNSYHNQLLFGNFSSPSNSCFFESFNALEIISVIVSLKNTNSKYVDGVSNICLKKIQWFIVDVLCFIFNLSLETGNFPHLLKQALVMPLFKKGNKDSLNNYRPISLLSPFSKIFEKLIKLRLLKYLNKINFISKSQFGFMKGRSTDDALLNCLSFIYSALNDHKQVVSVFVDITKAFDTVDHNLLLKKLYHIGIRGNLYNLFSSYLSNRSQVVKIGKHISSPGLLQIGVPQGSVLGPLLFLIYFNSVFDSNFSGFPTAFADDFCLSYSSKKIHIAENELNQDLLFLRDWFNCHKMLLSEKTKIMYFGGKSLPNISTFTYHSCFCNLICCNNSCFNIEIVTVFKYLGLSLDTNLNWKVQLDNIRKNVIIASCKFFKLRLLCSTSTLRMLYHTLVESVILYGIACWGGTYYSNINDLYIAQKRILKLIYFQPRQTRTIPFFRKINILPLRSLYVFKVLKLFFKKSLSFHLRNNLSYNTRNANLFLNFRCNTEQFRRFYLYMAPFWFQKLPADIRSLQINRVSLFNKLVKVWISKLEHIENYF